VKQQSIDMTLNGSGVRDIVRVLRVSAATVIDVLKKKAPAVTQVNERLLPTLDPEHVDVILRQVEKAEMDEMWSFGGSKSQQRWLWHAIDHDTGEIFAYVFGPREDETFLQLKEFLAPFGITHFYTDGWGAYRRHLEPSTHTVGKQHTQKIERKHITFRTRIKRLTRKSICFSRSILMHDLVIGLFITRYEFGYAV
jgi:insertion element IS1 protein InsB